MKLTSKFTVSSKRCSFLGLVIFIALIIACQDSHSSNSSQPKRTEQPASDQTPAPPPINQPSAANMPVAVQEEHAKKPAIQINEVPSKGGGGTERLETIAGTVSGVRMSDCKVVLFARTDVWYVQPYIASSDTAINADSTWRNDTHLGLEYAALLVKKSYKPPTTTGKLPEVGSMVLAIATANAKE